MNKLVIEWPSFVLKATTTHLVSCDDWISRTSLVDDGCAIVVRSHDHQLWLISTAELLTPDPAALRERAAQRGGPPVERSKISLVKLTLAWPGSDVPDARSQILELKMPQVVIAGDYGVAAVAIPARSHIAAHLDGPDSPDALPVDRAQRASFIAPDGRLQVCNIYTADDGTLWGTSRAAHFASRVSGGFAGRNDLTALDLAMTDSDRGCVVIAADEANEPCVGFTVRLSRGQAALVGMDAMLELIAAHAV